MLTIGNVRIENGLFLGPMAGVTDLPFRTICRQQHAGIVCTEMISAKAVLYGNKGTAALLRTVPDEHPCAVQLFGSDPKICAGIARILEQGPWDIIDFNMGCPVPKVVNNHEGSALMKDPLLAAQIISEITAAVKKPVTVKIRSGFDSDHINAPELAVLLEQAGAAAITVHARTREQMYHGHADRTVIKAVKEAVSIPVIGNGDIDSPEKAAGMIEETGCDGVMIARGALGDPWIFSRINEYLLTKKVTGCSKRDDPDMVRNMILRHLDMQIEYDGEYAGVREMRKHLAWYTHGFRGSSVFRDEINRIEDAGSLIKKINEFFDTQD